MQLKLWNYQTCSLMNIQFLDDAAKEFLQGETVPTVLHAFKEQLEALDVFDVPSIKAAIKPSKRNRR